MKSVTPWLCKARGDFCLEIYFYICIYKNKLHLCAKIFLPRIVNICLHRRRFLIYKAELNARKFIEKKNQTSCEFESVRDTGSRVSKYILLLTVNNLLK